MKLISLTICRDSAWCIEAVVGHALGYCDAAVVLCHACTDGTPDILRSMDRVSVIEVPGADRWDEMTHRQATLRLGRAIRGTHFLILDDDEVAAEPMAARMRDVCHKLAPGEVAMMPMVCCWRDLDHYRSDGPGNPFANLHKSTVFADAPYLSWESRGGYHHHHTHPFGSTQRRFTPAVHRWMHLQHASWPRLVVKQTWYMAMELLRYGEVRANYRGSMSETGLELSPIPEGWWPDVKSKIDLDAPPWQLEDLRRMIRQKGPRFFRQNDIPIDRALSYWK